MNTTPETMTHSTFDDLTPPDDLKQEWRNATDWRRPDTDRSLDPLDLACRWGAEQAAERLKGQWPEPITDRPPTEDDANHRGVVQYLDDDRWQTSGWELVARAGDDWQHCLNWQPPAPPTLKEQTPLEEAAMNLICLWDNGARFEQDSIDELRQAVDRALEADS